MFIVKNMRKIVSMCLICVTLALSGTVVMSAEKAGKAKKAELKPQVTCPIMAGKLNKKLYVDAKGKRIYVCCQGCVTAVKKDPEAALKKLAKLGEKAIDIPVEQTTCPVMGGPINKKLYVEYKGKKLYVCCEACVAMVKKNPEKYAKKIAEQIAEKKEKETAAVWTCKMHPKIRKNKPGNCPICSMKLVPVKKMEGAMHMDKKHAPEKMKKDM